MPPSLQTRNLLTMRYFTPELISAANDWVDQSRAQHRKAEARLATIIKKYQRDLEGLKSRLSQDAWQFFRYGFGSTSLHDARLLSLQVGDGLGYVADGQQPFRLNQRNASVVIEFLNYEQDGHYIFDLRKVTKVRCDLFVAKNSYARSIGDLYTYELAAVDDKLQLGLLFATGASIVVQFGRIIFRRKALRRNYSVSEIYD